MSRTIKQHYEIDVPLEKVWSAFVEPTEIQGWGGGPAKMEGKEGYRFSLWGGDIYGKNTKVMKEKILEQDWYGGRWDKPSKVVFNFLEKDGKTIIDLVHTDLPEGEEDNFDAGWKDYYIGAIKEYLEP